MEQHGAIHVPTARVRARNAHGPGQESPRPMLFGAAQRRLLLSGTPFRSDASPIPGVSYDAQGLVEPDVSYAYGDAILDGVEAAAKRG